MLASHVKQKGYYLIPKIKLLDKYQRWRKVAEVFKISQEAKQRLNWIIYYHKHAERNATLTARYFGISRKTFHKWFKLFDENNLHTLKLLEDSSKAQTISDRKRLPKKRSKG